MTLNPYLRRERIFSTEGWYRRQIMNDNVIVCGLDIAEGMPVRVLDVGCGANLIYPLLGAAMHGWSFVGVDITDVAIQWAQKNKESNPALARLLEIRGVQQREGEGNEAGKHFIQS